MTDWTPVSLQAQDPVAYEETRHRFLQELRGLMGAAFQGPDIDVEALKQLTDEQVQELIISKLPDPLRWFQRHHIETLFAWYETPTPELEKSMMQLPLGMELLQPNVQDYVREHDLNPDGNDVPYIRVEGLVFIQRLLELADEHAADAASS